MMLAKLHYAEFVLDLSMWYFKVSSAFADLQCDSSIGRLCSSRCCVIAVECYVS